MKLSFSSILLHGTLLCGSALGMGLTERLGDAHEAFLTDRRAAFSGLSDPFGVPEAARVVIEDPSGAFRRGAAWKRNVVTTVFWVGEQPTENNPTPNNKSAWDQNWEVNFGGYDDPNSREGYLPKGFVPRLNPFYVALPYNDIGKNYRHRPEASQVIPMVLGALSGRWYFGL